MKKLLLILLLSLPLISFAEENCVPCPVAKCLAKDDVYEVVFAGKVLDVFLVKHINAKHPEKSRSFEKAVLEVTDLKKGKLDETVTVISTLYCDCDPTKHFVVGKEYMIKGYNPTTESQRSQLEHLNAKYLTDFLCAAKQKPEESQPANS